MVTLFVRLKQPMAAVGAAVLLLPAASYAQSYSSPKLDESLRESLERGCVGLQPVIVSTKPCFRQALRDSLALHGDIVKGEFPAIEAIEADVHCEDLLTLAEFDSTVSVSSNGAVGVQSLLTSLLSDSQTAVTAARTALVAAKATALEAQRAVRDAEKSVAAAGA